MTTTQERCQRCGYHTGQCACIQGPLTPRQAAREPGDPVPLLTPGEVATLFRVDPKTVTRWAKAGKFPPDSVIRTLGGHRRYKTSAVQALLNGAPK